MNETLKVRGSRGPAKIAGSFRLSRRSIILSLKERRSEKGLVSAAAVRRRRRRRGKGKNGRRKAPNQNSTDMSSSCFSWTQECNLRVKFQFKSQV
jgi:hypothetical protein